MKFIFTPFLFLVLFWLALSGHYTTLLLVLGAASCIWIQLISKRMDIVDHEGYPIHLVPWRIALYLIWLIKEIIVSTWAVTRMILSPRRRVQPTVRRIPADGLSEMEKAIYANSITLTPGTLTIETDKDELEIHTLRGDMLESLERGDMAERIRGLKPNPDRLR